MRLRFLAIIPFHPSSLPSSVPCSARSLTSEMRPHKAALSPFSWDVIRTNKYDEKERERGTVFPRRQSYTCNFWISNFVCPSLLPSFPPSFLPSLLPLSQFPWDIPSAGPCLLNFSQVKLSTSWAFYHDQDHLFETVASNHPQQSSFVRSFDWFQFSTLCVKFPY